MYGTEHMGIGMGWGGLWMIGVWLIPIVLVLLLLRWSGDRRQQPKLGDEGDARSVLDARFARGDIDSTEYVERKRALDT